MGTSGVLLTCWCENFFKVEHLVINNRFVLAIGQLNRLIVTYRIRNIYASNDEIERQNFYENLVMAIRAWDIVWYLKAYFNAIKCIEERIGCDHVDRLMSQFNNFIEKSSLMDLLMIRGNFTWCSFLENVTFSRLDLFLVMVEVAENYQNFIQKCLSSSISDHTTIILC